MADPLTLLRACIINNEDVIINGNDVVFGDLSWPKTVETNFMVFGSGNNGEPKKYYTLECLLYLIKNVNLAHPVYVRQAAAKNIPIVRRPDRKKLLAYLNGEQPTHTSIDKSAPLEIPTQVKRSVVEGIQELAAKKRRIEETLNGHMVKQQLGAPNESAANVDNIKSFYEAMSVKKISAIKAKRLAKKRTTIKGHDDLDIIKREREWRTRTNTLQSNGKVFGKNIFAILQSVKSRKDGRSRPIHSMSATPRVAPTKPTIPQLTVYNRYDQERFIKSREDTKGFKNDTMSTYHGMALKSVTDEGLIPKKPVATVTPVQQSSSNSSYVDIYKTGGNCTLSNTTEKVIGNLGYCFKPLNNPLDCNSEYSDYTELMNTGQPDQYIIKTVNEGNLSDDFVDNYYSTNWIEESLTNKRSPEELLATRKKIVKTLDNQSVNHGAGTSYPVTVGQDVNLKKYGSSAKKIFEGLHHSTSKHLNRIEDKEKYKENLNLLASKKAKLQLEILEMEYNIMVLRHDTEKEKCTSELKQNKLKEQILESELKQNKMKESILLKQLIDCL